MEFLNSIANLVHPVERRMRRAYIRSEMLRAEPDDDCILKRPGTESGDLGDAHHKPTPNEPPAGYHEHLRLYPP